MTDLKEKGMSFVEILTALTILSMLVVVFGYYIFLSRNIRSLQQELTAMDLAASLAEKILSDSFMDFKHNISSHSDATLYDETKEILGTSYYLKVRAEPVRTFKVHCMNLSGRVIEADMAEMLPEKLYRVRVISSWFERGRKEGDLKEFFLDLLKGAHEAVYEQQQ